MKHCSCLALPSSPLPSITTHKNLVVSFSKATDSASLTLLGGWQMALVKRSTAEPDYEKGRALLAYLAIEDQLHSREALSELLWPGSPVGRANLRQVLANLRAVLQDDAQVPYILVKRDSLRINPQGRLALDVLAFTANITADTSLTRLEQLVGLYHGEFMAGFALPDCLEFEDWLHLQRETLHRRALALLEQLSNGYERLGDYPKALQFALRYAALEPWDEVALRRVMRLYALNSQYSAALRQYEACCARLQADLGVLPGEETRRMAERVRQGEWQQRAPRSVPAAVCASALSGAGRRHVTVLYCELTSTCTDDQEDDLALLVAPQTRCAEIIQAFGGHLVQTFGGGLLAYFGYPQAQEDSARRAVQAALTLTRVVPSGQPEAGFELRAGIHTGWIITAGGDAAMPDSVGKTSRRAIALRLCAPPHQVAISAATQRLVGGYFDCNSQGPQVLAGQGPALEVFIVQHQSAARTRLDAARQLSPFAGRVAELARLQSLWQLAAQGKSQAVLLQGEAGIGKSRLLRVFQQQLVGERHALRELNCFPEFSQSPFHPLIAMFEAILGFRAEDAPEQKRAALSRYFDARYPAARHADLALLSRLLDVPLAADTVPALPAQQAKERTMDLVLEMLQTLAAQLPTLLIVEDLHWIDPSTHELLSRLISQPLRGAVMVIFTARPNFAPSWSQAQCATLPLGPLAQGEVAALVNGLAHQLAPATLGQIVQRADGVALFAEELAHLAMLGDDASIPATLQDLLAARVDQLGAAKPVAQMAATLGREFDVDVLQKLWLDSPEALTHGLRALHAADLVVTVSVNTRQFRHALIQQAAYQSQSKVQRIAVHQRIAEVLVADFPDAGAKRPELVAQHLTAGGDGVTAINYWMRAAQRAALNSANLEAIEHFRSALRLLSELPADLQHQRTERELLLGLCPVLYAVKGYGCEEAESLSARIAVLNAQLGQNAKLFQTRWTQMVSTIASVSSRGMPQAALQLLAMAQDDPLKKMAAHTLAAIASFWLGDFGQARAHDEHAIALYQPDQRQLQQSQFAAELVVNCEAYQSCALYFLGFSDQAQKVSRQMLAQARALAHPHNLGQALSFAALLQRWLNQPEAALALAAEAIALSRQHDFQLWLACGEMTHGWARVKIGQADGIAEISNSVATMRQALGGIPVVFLSSRIEAYVHLRLHAKALDLLAQALADAHNTGDAHYLAELHRLKGVCLLALAPGNAAEAELCFSQALDICRQQNAMPLALRAATSLVSLWQQQGKLEAGRSLLKEMLGAFSEGFDTHDLRDATQQLQTLG